MTHGIKYVLRFSAAALCSALCVMPLRTDGENRDPPVAGAIHDSLLTPHYVYYYSISNPELSGEILAGMRRRARVTGWYADKLEADLNYNNRNYNLAVFYYDRVLANDSMRMDTDMYGTTLIGAADAYEKIGNYNKAIAYLKQSTAASERSGDLGSLGMAYALLGVILYEQCDSKKAYDYLELAVTTLEESDYQHKYPRIFDIYANLALFKAEEGDYAAACGFIDRMPAIIESSGADSSEFVENYMAVMWKDYHNYRATVLQGMGDDSGARESYRMWSGMDQVESVNDHLILDYLMAAEWWDETIRYLGSFDDEVERNPYSHLAQRVARALASIYESRGRDDLALRYSKKVSEIIDTIRVRENRSEALEYATIYETQKKDAELAERNASLDNQRKVTRILLALCAISVAALLSIIFIDRRRRAAYKVLVEKNRRWAGAVLPDADMDADDLQDEPPSDKDIKIMALVKEYIEDGCNYRNPTLNLDSLAVALQINRKYISTAVNRLTRSNFNAYVNELRVKEAVRLLSGKGGPPTRNKRSMPLTIDDISERVGFNNRASFYEWFKKYTALTPAQFRHNIPDTDD